jgi:hypothetical protein
MLKRYVRPETVFFLLLWLGLLRFGGTGMMRDPGMFWHTAVGERIIDNRDFFDRDPYSFTHQGETWIPNQWFCECLFALLYRLGGLDALLLFTVTLLAGLYTWVAARLIRAGFHWSLAVFVVVLVLVASSSHFHVRPHIGSIVFLGITQGLLCDVEMGRAPFRRLFWLVPLFILWTNWHGAVLGGLATLAVTLLGWGAFTLLGRSSPLAVRSFGMAVGLFLLCAVTILVNPYGIGIPRAWYSILGTGELSRIIKEHAPLNPLSADGAAVLFVGALYIAAVTSAWPAGLRVTWLVPIIWFLATTRGIRHAPLFAVTAALALADLVPLTGWAQRLAKARDDLFFFPPKMPALSWQALVLPAFCVVGALALQAGGVSVPLVGRGWAQPDDPIWPIEVAADLARYEHTFSNGTPIFNEYSQGGYLIKYHPGYKVFVDDRCELYRPEWLTEYVDAEHQNTAEHLKGWKIQYEERPNRSYPWFDFALTVTDSEEHPSAFDRYFHDSPEWVLVRRGKAASFYRRREATHE